MSMHIHKVVIPLLMLVIYSSVTNAASPTENYFQVVFDTTHTVSEGYKKGFGYSVFVNYDGEQFLFDTGEDGDVLLSNLQQAHVDLKALKFVAISHDHADHAGGLASIMAVTPKLKVYIAPGHDVGVDDAQIVSDHIKISPNIYLLRTHTEKPTAGISDEISLMLVTRQGPYLFTGCSHTGVATIVDKAKAVAGSDIFYYTGGSRLIHGSKQDIHNVANALKERKVAHVSPGHCSVSHEVARVFKQTLPTSYTASRLGEKVPLEPVK
jgi:7,8-dihydropterin-6-yl-methyl-4-(beta-D-ribofuranosyl)aminobenzene 5'-phosphate synthase